jgi:hypothetical protein
VPVVVRIGPGIEPGWLVVAVGVGMDVVGWYQISGQAAEAQQLPYLASATIPGAALIIAGAVLIAARRRPGADGGGGSGRLGGAIGTGRRGGLWTLPDGSYLHRGECPLLDGKPEAFEVTAGGEGSAPGLSARRPCPVCEPDPVGTP